MADSAQRSPLSQSAASEQELSEGGYHLNVSFMEVRPSQGYVAFPLHTPGSPISKE